MNMLCFADTENTAKDAGYLPLFETNRTKHISRKFAFITSMQSHLQQGVSAWDPFRPFPSKENIGWDD